MPSEIDPLLPNNEPAPEIVGYGYSRAQKEDYYDDSQTQTQYQTHVDKSSVQHRGRETDSESQAGTNSSPLRTIFSIFTIVVGFGLILSILISGEFGKSPKAPQIVPSKPATSINERVEKILSEHPLIGHHISKHISRLM